MQKLLNSSEKKKKIDYKRVTKITKKKSSTNFLNKKGKVLPPN